MTTYKTEQEHFWSGEFGEDYISRNQDDAIIRGNLHLFAKIISRTQGLSSVLELGANIGLNLQALQMLNPTLNLSAIEINQHACQQLQKLSLEQIYHQSILEFSPSKTYDMCLMKGVLIHIHPDYLSQVYQTLYNSSARYICLVEYYNPVPVEVNYRGHSQKLFKRDFAGEMLDQYPDLQLVDYGFRYHRDPNIRGGDDTWFLLEKV